MDPGGVDRLPLMDERWKDVDEDFSGKRVTVFCASTTKYRKETSSYDQLKD